MNREQPGSKGAILNSNQGWSCQEVTFDQRSGDENEEAKGRSEESIQDTNSKYKGPEGRKDLLKLEQWHEVCM